MSLRRVSFATVTVAVALLSACSSSASTRSTASTSAAATSSGSAGASANAPSTPGTPTSFPAVTGSPASSDVTAAVTAALQQFAAADTPETICPLLSQQWQKQIGNGVASGCAANVEKAFGGLVATTATVQNVVISYGQAVVPAVVTPPSTQPTNFFFVQEDGGWKLNSFGVRQ